MRDSRGDQPFVQGRDVIGPKSVLYLPRLKKMHLENWQIDPSAVEKLNSGWSSLEDLNLSRY
jgi:hypothetical protein